ncbi:MAG: hypothetical protein ACR65R_16960 [Methylomicrobium sp.]
MANLIARIADDIFPAGLNSKERLAASATAESISSISISMTAYA